MARISAILVATVALCFIATRLPAAEPPFDPSKLPPPAKIEVDFTRDVRPLLSRCTQCHGADKQESGLRLHRKAEAMTGGDNGVAIVPGKSAESRLVRYVSGQNPDLLMPPKGKGEPLTTEQISLVRAWIDQGAKWPDDVQVQTAAELHWAYKKPVRPALPQVKNKAWPRNDVDYFVLARLEAEGLSPSPEVDRARLLRRVSLDLIGLPPTPQEVDDFLADKRPDAYERVVDRLLASPHYGERWTRMWLDLARYADTHGFEKDPRRTQWPYRDWVIQALNDDMPFDRFTIEQLAGDLLPGATQQQRIATGFHRNTMINTEGGVDAEEYRIAAAIDRVNTTATVWLGSTLACAQCHSHKYDPFKQKEYYQFLAFFNSTADSGSSPEPELAIESPAVPELRQQIAAVEATINTATPELAAAQDEWEKKLDDAARGKLPGPIQEILKIAGGQRNEKQNADLAAQFRSIAPSLQATRDKLAGLKKSLDGAITKTMVMQELDKPRETHIHLGGNFLAKGELVEPGVPAVLNPLADDAPHNRLALAKWLVDPANPLTSRVLVNRLWEQYFGRGLVATSEDFGTRGEPPTHPELLDYMAIELIQRGWSIKAMQRLIVTSATYRQASKMTPQLVERDPNNRLLARGPRFRLEAEMIRDQALAAAGLLSSKVGGPSVMPPQPDGIWSQPYSGDRWTTSSGDDKYRRGLYTFWRRAAPYPSFMSFDAPSREFCVVRRPRSNTPLQALTVMNDPVYVEAAQGVARRMLTETSGDDAARAAYGFRLCLARPPEPAELDRLVVLYRAEVEHFRQDAKAAEVLLKPLADSTAAKPNPAEWAAWTVVANVLLNLDEMITKG